MEGGKFHTVFCEAQAQAQRLAEEFNAHLARLPGVTIRTPRITFLECKVFVVVDANWGHIGLLVEKMLDPAAYQKWNNNGGYVAGRVAEAAPHLSGGALRPPLIEGAYLLTHSR